MNVDVEIYHKNIINFFESNPDQLKILIGSIDKELFYEKVKEVANKNFVESNEPSLTRKQMVDLVWELHIQKIKIFRRNIFESTSYGTYCLN
jgi:hypothetical protein